MMNRNIQSENRAMELGNRNSHVKFMHEEDDNDDELESLVSDYTEDVSIRKQNLTPLDVGSLILNKMVGTGIFTTIGTVLDITNSKTVSIVIWALGGVYCALCLTIYLDYGTALPYNGGELIYLNKVWNTPELLSAVLFAGFFISLGHTAGNAVAFSRLALVAANRTLLFEEPSSITKTNSVDLNPVLVKIFAIVILGVVCLLLWMTPKMGMFLNRGLALYKVVLLLFIGFAGIYARHYKNSGISDWKPQPDADAPGFQKKLSGLIYIVYSYGGWENANYVIGDIHTKPRDLRYGAFAAVTIVTLLYTLVNVGYFLACESGVITGGSSDLGIAIVFADQVFGVGRHTQGIQISIAISAIGNLIAVAYTSSKVKQAIALHHFLPFSTFFAKDDSFGTPGPALLLHWICSSIVILMMKNNTDGYVFVLGLFAYGQLLVGLFIGMGFPKLEKALGKLRPGVWEPMLSSQWPRWVLGISLTILNSFMLVGAALPHDPGDIARFWWPLTLGIILCVSGFWWLVLLGLQGPLGVRIGWTARVEGAALDAFTDMNRQTRRDGAERMLVYTMPEYGPLGRLKHFTKPVVKWLIEKLY